MPPEAHAAHVAHHFPNAEQQAHAARLGMWLFLATEVLLFTVLFAGYSVYRYLYSDVWALASKHIDTGIGTANTFVLVTSSLSVAMGLHFAKEGKGKLATLCLAITLAFGLTFMVLKGVEYTHHFEEGQLPGRWYSYREVRGPGDSMFFTLYFLITGLHGLHVLVGMTVLAVLAVKAWRGRFWAGYYTPMELGALYWHLVDLIWIFIYPLIYLM